MDGSVCFDGSQFPAPRRSRGVVHRAHFTAPEKRQNAPLGRDAEPPEVPHESGIGTDCVITNWTELLTADGSVFPNQLGMLQLSRRHKQAIFIDFICVDPRSSAANYCSGRLSCVETSIRIQMLPRILQLSRAREQADLFRAGVVILIMNSF
jgi:hypothetical protein